MSVGAKIDSDATVLLGSYVQPKLLEIRDDNVHSYTTYITDQC